MEVSCKNCDTNLSPSYKHCPECGQKTVLHRLSLHEVLHEAIHYFTHADKGFFQLIRDLAVKNGAVAREFLNGKRKKYFPPLNFFLLAAAIYVFVATFDAPAADVAAVKVPARVSRIQNLRKREMEINRIERQAKVGPFMNKHSNMLGLAALPLTAFFFWFFYRKNKYNYTEHLVANMYMGGFSILLGSLVIFPISKMLGASGMQLAGLYFVSELIYFTLFYYRFLEKTTKFQWLKAFGVSFLTISSWFVLSTICVGIYIVNGFWGLLH